MPQTRRQFLGGSTGSEPAAAESAVLEDLAAVEQLTIAALQYLLEHPGMSRRLRRLTRRLLGQERGHLVALQIELRRQHRALPRAPRGSEEIDHGLGQRRVERRLADVRSHDDLLDLLLALEAIAEGAYYTAMEKLRHPRLLELAGRLLAAEAQHEVVLGQLRRPEDFDRATPYAFVEGVH